jgi:hypothetical protein
VENNKKFAIELAFEAQHSPHIDFLGPKMAFLGPNDILVHDKNNGKYTEF